MKIINSEQIKKELSNFEKPIGYETNSFPYNDLNSRQFEIILYYIFKEEIKHGKYENKFDGIDLMQGVHEQGRDCLLTFNGLNVGLIQCKKYKDKVNRSNVGLEIIKFILYCLIDKSLISDLNNFTYYFVVSDDFNTRAIDLFNELKRDEYSENEVLEWANKIIKKSKLLEDLKVKEIKQDIYDLLIKINFEKINSADLNLLLNSYPNIIKIFFSVKKVVVIEDIKDEIQNILVNSLNDLNLKDNQEIKFFSDTFFHPPITEFFIGRTTELTSLINALKDKNTISINGIAGIGKSYLVSKLIKEKFETFPIIWLDLSNDTMFKTILINIAYFLKDEFDDIELLRTIKLPILYENKIETAISLIEKYKCLIIFDNFSFKQNYSLIPFLLACNKLLVNGKIIITSKKALEIQDFLNVPFQITLKGLNKENSIALIKYYSNQFNLVEQSEEVYSELFNLVEGHPYFIRMLIFLSQWIPLEKLLEDLIESAPDVKDYIHKKIWQYLNDDEKDIMKGLSIIRIPFKDSAIQFFTNSEEAKTIFISLLKSFLISPWEIKKSYYIIHNLIRFYAISYIPSSELTSLHKSAINYYKNISEKNISERFEYIHHTIEAGLIDEGKKEIKEFLKVIYISGFFDLILKTTKQFLSIKELDRLDFIHFFRGRVFRIIKKYENAIKSYHKALECEEEMFQNDIILFEIASTLIEKSDENYNEAISYYEKLKESKNIEIRLKSSGSIAYLNLLYNELDDEKIMYYLKVLENIIEEAKKRDLYRIISECYQMLGLIYFNNNENIKSLEYYNNALSYQKKYSSVLTDISGDIMKRYFLYDNISQVLIELENYQEALKYSKKCVEIDKNLKFEKRYAKSLYFHGYLLCLNNKYHKARKFLEKSLSLALKLNLDIEKTNITLYWLIFSLWNLKEFKLCLEKILEYREWGGTRPIPMMSGLVREKFNSSYGKLNDLSIVMPRGITYVLIIPDNISQNLIIKWIDEILEKRPELINQAKLFEFQKTEEIITQSNSSNKKRVKIGRNAKCPCGSGKKYKYCHGKLKKDFNS